MFLVREQLSKLTMMNWIIATISLAQVRGILKLWYCVVFERLNRVLSLRVAQTGRHHHPLSEHNKPYKIVRPSKRIQTH